MTAWRAIGGTIGAALAGAAGAAAVMLAALPRDAPAGPTVKAYLLDHPEIVSQALDRLRDRQTAALIAANRAQITSPFPGAIAGNPDGDVTVAEFYDYACGYCRQSVADIDRLVAADHGVRVVFKELPVLSPLSEPAAKLSLAAARAGRFGAFHHALFAAGVLDQATLTRVAQATGVHATDAKAPDIAREIEANGATASAIQIGGTPTFVIGDRILSGAVGYAALKEAVAAARARR